MKVGPFPGCWKQPSLRHPLAKMHGHLSGSKWLTSFREGSDGRVLWLDHELNSSNRELLAVDHRIIARCPQVSGLTIPD